MLLQAAFGISQILTTGATSEAHAALTKAANLAESLEDADERWNILFRDVWP